MAITEKGQSYLSYPDYKTTQYYTEQLFYWLPADELGEMDLTQCSQPGDIIDEHNRTKLLWFHDSEKKLLYIPSSNAHIILLHLYNIDVPPKLAQAWLKCLGFCGAYKSSGTHSLYTGVTIAPTIKPQPKKVQHCHVFDTSLEIEECLELQPTVKEREDMMKSYSPLYASPARWMQRRVEKQLIGEMVQHGRTSQPVPVTKRSKEARQQFIHRLKKRFSQNDPEFQDLLAKYDRGERSYPGRPSASDYEKRQQVARQTHARLVYMLQDWGVKHGPNIETHDPVQPPPIVSRSEYHSPEGFGAVHATMEPRARLTDGNAVAFVWRERPVQLPKGDHAVTQIISIAVALPWIEKFLPEYNKACSYDGLRVMPKAYEQGYGFQRLAVFTHTAHKKAKTKTKRSNTKKEIDQLKAQIEWLTNKLGEGK